MSEWNRNDRNEMRRFEREDRDRDWNERERGSQGRGESRSFYGQGGYGGGRRTTATPSYIEPGGGYSGETYERPAYGGGYGGQGYGSQGYGSQGRSDYDRGYGRSDRERGGYGRSGYEAGDRSFGDPNEEVRRVADGDEGGGMRRMFGAMGAGQHRGKGPKNYTRSDERIRDDINDRLSDDAWLDASDIEVAVDACEVTLSGTVTSRDDKRRAEDLAEHVSGVKHVQNNIRVQAQDASAWRHLQDGVPEAGLGGPASMTGGSLGSPSGRTN